MGVELESEILDLAVERGLVSAADAAGDGPPSQRLARLLDSGRLSQAALASLTDEAQRTVVGSVPLDPDATMQTDGRLPPSTAAASFPTGRDRDVPADWDRYTGIELLGEGGMGRVYRATDPRLHRQVALKFLRGHDPELVDRFLSEARTQARVEHENVCQIHEVGEVGGRPYIAMQLINGSTLGVASKRLELDEVVGAVAKVCRAVHAAHRQGLVHRDLKPANIMVEHDADGGIRPYVLDFGLAREQAAEGATVTGLILGTPGFMAPEQARGDKRAIDARTDVWALGATLYDVLTGRPPHQGSVLEVLSKLGVEEITPLRRIRPELPADLEVVVLKCLETDPDARYASALDLAEDLERHLAGEPVLAQAPSLTRVVRRRIRRYRVAVAAGSVAFAALVIGAVVVGTVVWRARLAAERGHAIAQEVPRLEERVRLSYSRPLHDVTGELAEVRTRLDQLAHEAEAAGGDVGAVRYALARGYLAIDEPAEAQRHVQAAWERGYREPEVAYALGLAHIELYREGLEASARLGDAGLAATRRAALEAQHLAPALEALSQAANAAVEAPELVEALVAAARHEWDAALAAAARAKQRIPWLVAADRLAGEIELERGRAAYDHGEYDQAREALGRSETAFGRVAASTPSDPRGHLGLCASSGDRILVAAETGARLEEPYHDALAACGDALTADPSSAAARHAVALAHLRWAEHEARRGGDPTEALELAEAESRKLLESDPDDPAALTHLGIATRRSAQLVAAKGDDPGPLLERATNTLERAVELEPGSSLALNNLGLAWFFWGLTEYDAGRDPRPAAARAVDAFERLLELNPDQVAPLDNMGVALWLAARHALLWGDDPTPDLHHAAEVLQRAVSVNANDTVALANLGLVHAELAGFRVRRGEDPTDDLDRAEVWCRRVREINPLDPYAVANLAQVDRLRARWAADTGVSPEPYVERSLATAREAAALNPSDAEPWLIAGEAHAVRGRWRAAAGGSPVDDYRQAAAALGRALELNPRSVDARTSLVRVEVRWALWRDAAGQRAERELAAARDAAAPLASDQVDRGDALAARGLVELLAAELAGPQARPDAAARARELLTEAVRRNRWLEPELLGDIARAEELAG